MLNLKTILVLCLMAAFVFGTSTTAQTSSNKEYAYSTSELNELTPYMTLNKDHSVTFNLVKAKLDKLPLDDVRWAKEYEKYHNQLMELVKTKGIYSEKVRKFLDESKFEKLFESKTINNVRGACGGGFQQPHSCPSRRNSGVNKNSQNAISNYLRNNGFHNTYYPGCGPNNYECPTDFTKWVNAYQCVWGSFRTQANTFKSGSKWTYSTQTPEPNPEIFDYDGPVYWWGPYVTWWHIAFCN